MSKALSVPNRMPRAWYLSRWVFSVPKYHLSDLQLIDEPVITAPSLQRTGAGKIKMSKSASVRTEINLLGKTVDEAVAELDKYLDDAYLAHLSSVRVVHGKGTGALRKGVHNYLKRLKYVQDFHLGRIWRRRCRRDHCRI